MTTKIKTQPSALAEAGDCGRSSLKRLVGHSYVFLRDNHDWHSCEVSVIAIKGKRFTVARSCDVADGFLAPQGSPKRKLKTWTCTEDELW